MDFSVVVPTHNRVQLLQNAVRQLLAQDFDNYEIIIVDDGSMDSTKEYLHSLAGDGRIRFISQKNQGPAAARNTGLREARGTYVAFTDDDCVVPPDWIRKFHVAFESTGADIVGGRVLNTVEGNIYSQVSQDIINHFVEYLSRNGRSSPFLTSNNVAYRTDVIRAAGGFDERFRRAGAEERALNHRILANDHQSVYIPDNVVQHYHVMTFRSFLRQQMNYGCGSYLLYRVSGKDSGKAPKPMSLSAYGALLRRCFDGGLLKGMQKLGLVILSQLMVVIGFITEAWTFRRA